MLAGQGIETLNFGIGIVTRLGENEPWILFRRPNKGSHFNEIGNAMLAEIAYEYLQEKQLLSR